METDWVIAGGGLAGTTLAWELLGLGQEVKIVDPLERETSSRVAAGLVTPVTGKGLNVSWRFAELQPVAVAFYRELEVRLGAKFYYEMPIVRVFGSEKERVKWEKKREWPEIAEWVEDGDAAFPETVDAPFGGFVMKGGGYLDVEAFLAASHGRWREEGVLDVGKVDLESLPESRCGTVLCLGAAAAGVAPFDWVPFRAAKGEILDLESAHDASQVMNQVGTWLLPVGQGKFRTGATYSWEPLDAIPTCEGREDVERRVRGFLKADYEVTGHRAGVRPVIAASKALMGRHPSRPEVVFFNGLGSKGVLVAPFFARMLARHLVLAEGIEDEVNLAKILAQSGS